MIFLILIICVYWSIFFYVLNCLQPYLSFLLWTWNISISAYKLTNHKYVHFLFVCLRKWWNKWEGKVFQKKKYIYKQASLASLWTFSVFVDSLIKFSHAFNLSHFEAPQRSVKKKKFKFSSLRQGRVKQRIFFDCVPLQQFLSS